MANTTGKKYGGRKKGTPNKLTKELRSLLKDLLYEELETISTRLDELKPKERLEIVLKLMPYVFPTIEKVHPTVNEPVDWDF